MGLLAILDVLTSSVTMATKLFQSQRTSANNDDDPLPTNFKKMSTEDPTEGIAVRKELESYLNKRMRIAISDGRVIDGLFLCTDRDCNIVLGNCEEFLSQEEVGMLYNNSMLCIIQACLLNFCLFL